MSKRARGEKGSRGGTRKHSHQALTPPTTTRPPILPLLSSPPLRLAVPVVHHAPTERRSAPHRPPCRPHPPPSHPPHRPPSRPRLATPTPLVTADRALLLPLCALLLLVLDRRRRPRLLRLHPARRPSLPTRGDDGTRPEEGWWLGPRPECRPPRHPASPRCRPCRKSCPWSRVHLWTVWCVVWCGGRKQVEEER